MLQMYVCVCIFGLIHTSYMQPVLHVYTYKYAGFLMITSAIVTFSRCPSCRYFCPAWKAKSRNSVCRQRPVAEGGLPGRPLYDLAAAARVTVYAPWYCLWSLLWGRLQVNFIMQRLVMSTAPSCEFALVLPSVPLVLPSVAPEEGSSVENDGDARNDACISSTGSIASDSCSDRAA